MIIQGSNNPLVIKFSTSVEDLPQLVVSLWEEKVKGKGSLLKTWRKEDMTLNNDTAICPVTEQLTQSLPSGNLVVLAKGLDDNGETIFWDEYRLPVKERLDRTIALTQTGG